jgi:hypothetical protein
MFGLLSAEPNGGNSTLALCTPPICWGGGGGTDEGVFSTRGVELMVSKLPALSTFVPVGCTVPQSPQKRVCGGSSSPHDTHLFTEFLPPN